MILDPNISLMAVLSGAVSANQPEYHVYYTAWNDRNEQAKPAPARGALNNTTDVTLLAAPSQGYVNEINNLSVYNKDTASVTVTLKTTDGTTQRIICRVVLATLESLHFSDDADTWIVLTSSGAAKGNSGISGPASSTNNGLVRWNGTSGTVVQDSSDLTYDGTTLTLGSSKFTVAAASGNTVVAGTLGVTGATTLAALSATTGTFSSTLQGAQLFVTGTAGDDTAYFSSNSATGNPYITFRQTSTTRAAIQYLNAGSALSFSAGTGIAEQVRITGTASATRYITLTGSNGGNSEIDVSAGLLSIGSTSVTINVKSGGSTTISTGVGSVKMSTGNAATNTAWIPLAYAGTTYYVPAWTTNAP